MDVTVPMEQNMKNKENVNLKKKVLLPCLRAEKYKVLRM